MTEMGTHEQKTWWEFTRARQDRLQLDLQWYVQNSWYLGDTDVFFDERGGSGAEVYRVSYSRPRSQRVRPINWIGKAVDIRVAKQMKAEPTLDCAPASAESKDILSARAARDWLRSLWSRERLGARRRTLYINRIVTGNSFAKVFFDSELGPKKKTKVPCEMCEGESKLVVDGFDLPCPTCNGKGFIEDKETPRGDVGIEFIPPWDIYPAPNARSIETSPYIFHAYRISEDEARERYEIDGDLSPSSSLEEGDSQFSRWARQNRVADQESSDIYVLERYDRPAFGSKKPRLSILVGNQLVHPKPGSKEAEDGVGVEMKEEYGRIPIYHFRDRPAAENFWARGNVMDMISANDTVNRARANLHRHITTLAYVKWLVEKGSVSKNAINNEVGEIIEYNGVNPPRQQSPAAMPEYIMRAMADEKEAVFELAGVSRLDRGDIPPNVEAAEAFQVLIEQSDTIHGPISIEDEDVWRDIGLAAIKCAVANYDKSDDILVKTVGPGGEVEARALRSADLAGELDVRVEVGSAVVHSLALRRAQALQWYEAGLITAPEARRMSEFGIIGGEEDKEVRLQEASAMGENEDIEHGLPHETQAGVDDHKVHARVHRLAAVAAKVKGDIFAMQKFADAAIAHDQELSQIQDPESAGDGGGGGKGAEPPPPPFDATTPAQQQGAGAPDGVM